MNIANADFEENCPINATEPCGIDGWTTDGHVDWWRVPSPGHPQNCAVDLSGRSPGEITSSAFPTTADVVYRVTFDVSANHSGRSRGPKKFSLAAVSATGELAKAFFVTKSAEWTSRTWEFTGDGTPVRLVFESHAHSKAGAFIDNIQVSVPPNPQACEGGEPPSAQPGMSCFPSADGLHGAPATIAGTAAEVLSGRALAIADSSAIEISEDGASIALPFASTQRQGSLLLELDLAVSTATQMQVSLSNGGVQEPATSFSLVESIGTRRVSFTLPPMSPTQAMLSDGTQGYRVVLTFPSLGEGVVRLESARLRGVGERQPEPVRHWTLDAAMVDVVGSIASAASHDHQLGILQAGAYRVDVLPESSGLENGSVAPLGVTVFGSASNDTVLCTSEALTESSAGLGCSFTLSEPAEASVRIENRGTAEALVPPVRHNVTVRSRLASFDGSPVELDSATAVGLRPGEAGSWLVETADASISEVGAAVDECSLAEMRYGAKIVWPWELARNNAVGYIDIYQGSIDSGRYFMGSIEVRPSGGDSVEQVFAASAISAAVGLQPGESIDAVTFRFRHMQGARIDWLRRDELSNTEQLAIGPLGGAVASVGGGQIVVPAGALSEQAVIGIRTHTDVLDRSPALPVEFEPVGAFVELLPHGQQFSLPVTVSLPAPGCMDGQTLSVLRRPDATAMLWSDHATATCSGGVASFETLQFSVLGLAANLPDTVETEHFSIRYTDDDSSPHRVSPETLAKIVAWSESAFSAYAPQFSRIVSPAKHNVRIVNLAGSNGQLAYDGVVRIDSDVASDADLEHTVYHEFFHRVQMAYGYGLLFDPLLAAQFRWVSESSAVGVAEHFIQRDELADSAQAALTLANLDEQVLGGIGRADTFLPANFARTYRSWPVFLSLLETRGDAALAAYRSVFTDPAQIGGFFLNEKFLAELLSRLDVADFSLEIRRIFERISSSGRSVAEIAPPFGEPNYPNLQPSTCDIDAGGGTASGSCEVFAIPEDVEHVVSGQVPPVGAQFVRVSKNLNQSLGDAVLRIDFSPDRDCERGFVLSYNQSQAQSQPGTIEALESGRTYVKLGGPSGYPIMNVFRVNGCLDSSGRTEDTNGTIRMRWLSCPQGQVFDEEQEECTGGNETFAVFQANGLTFQAPATNQAVVGTECNDSLARNVTLKGLADTAVLNEGEGLSIQATELLLDGEMIGSVAAMSGTRVEVVAPPRDLTAGTHTLRIVLHGVGSNSEPWEESIEATFPVVVDIDDCACPADPCAAFNAECGTLETPCGSFQCGESCQCVGNTCIEECSAEAPRWNEQAAGCEACPPAAPTWDSQTRSCQAPSASCPTSLGPNVQYGAQDIDAAFPGDCENPGYFCVGYHYAFEGGGYSGEYCYSPTLAWHSSYAPETSYGSLEDLWKAWGEWSSSDYFTLPQSWSSLMTACEC